MALPGARGVIEADLSDCHIGTMLMAFSRQPGAYL